MKVAKLLQLAEPRDDQDEDNNEDYYNDDDDDDDDNKDEDDNDKSKMIMTMRMIRNGRHLSERDH
jgi:hypothetical protein